MRVVRIKHKAGLAVFVTIFLVLLFVLISKHSSPEIEVDEESFTKIPTRTVDFVHIANKVPVEEKRQDSLQNTPLVRGKLKSNFRKPPRPPKRRISDGSMDRTVIKNVVHGDALSGPSKGSIHRQRDKTKPLESNHNNKKVVKTPKPEINPPKEDLSSYTIAIVVISCNRPDAITRSLNGLLKYRPSAKQFPIVVSQDCGHEETAKAISVFSKDVHHIKQPDLSEPDVPQNMKRFTGYFKISRHFKWALGQMFDKFGYDTVLIVEDDLDIALDFYDYFLGTRHLLDQDPSIWCVSAWNDNGKAGLIEPNENGKLYRSDFFPGLGWMMTKKLWKELGPKWPAGFWDDWMREPAQRKDRACIRPEISRTKTFGRVGVSQGQFFDQHLKFIVLNDKKFDFLHTDLSYLIKENYDREFVDKIETLPVFSVDDIVARKIDNHKAVRVNYWTESTFNRVASRLGVMQDFKAGVPRAGYHGIVTVMYRGVRIYITLKK